MSKILILLCLTASLVFANFADKAHYVPQYALFGATYYASAPGDSYREEKFVEHATHAELPIGKKYIIQVSTVNKSYNRSSLNIADSGEFVAKRIVNPATLIPFPILKNSYGSLTLPIPGLIMQDTMSTGRYDHKGDLIVLRTNLSFALGLEKVDAVDHNISDKSNLGVKVGDDYKIKGNSVNFVMNYLASSTAIHYNSMQFRYSVYSTGDVEAMYGFYFNGGFAPSDSRYYAMILNFNTIILKHKSGSLNQQQAAIGFSFFIPTWTRATLTTSIWGSFDTQQAPQLNASVSFHL